MIAIYGDEKPMQIMAWVCVWKNPTYGEGYEVIRSWAIPNFRNGDVCFLLANGKGGVAVALETEFLGRDTYPEVPWFPLSKRTQWPA